MNTTNVLLDKYAAVCSLATDRDIAARLKVSKQAVSGWRNAKAHPNAEAVERMCTALGEPLREWLPLIEAERARTPADRKVWLRLAQASAAIALAACLYSFGRLDVQTLDLALLAPVYIMRIKPARRCASSRPLSRPALVDRPASAAGNGTPARKTSASCGTAACLSNRKAAAAHTWACACEPSGIGTPDVAACLGQPCACCICCALGNSAACWGGSAGRSGAIVWCRPMAGPTGSATCASCGCG